MINIGIYGAKGRMGKQIEECLKSETKAKTAALFDKGDNLEEFFEKSDVIIDFSSQNGTHELLNYARTMPKPLVIGTTGLDEKTLHLMQNASEVMPVFYATNMSLGVAVLNHLASKASQMLRNFDIEILEMHHRHKKDAPSGTAMTLAQGVAKARNLDLEKVRISGRDGIIGERSKDEIAVMSLRGGDIVGRHTVGFYEEGEFLELNHTATSRATFAKGAIKIAIWLNAQKPKMYSINDFLGI
ncbi:4-hydroxy-tetrahydrodipicolinate reductase [Campylobacter coli]|uniref:4-hydroxy-tetrahydrodipicolinate reductase n=1 Tax=Campylobacter coli TaxID=195 RepID=UPI0007084653|nr:4-hydroxy-tetrahydrodipicolinate reductase [Campylobacter coli]EAC1785761.1 4-hydroxy-tetrahydrodipicolinate reductase [Campylobacter coli]EAH9996680.1 4-hydroxy-tetrahydrodipicolinate reductase [Campylobacter coli]EAM0354755.1 4-hydroxy-tetrahydrodipicolinate reductase [Campylobacter coli]ECL3485133.1 4-hydroxy-tetrahydrodipicolinate reductase [Campylobacter coli]ECL9175432.1 4-hydroxy-tetrahydrodipicolinate reductase [Campylobacter coli]